MTSTKASVHLLIKTSVIPTNMEVHSREIKLRLTAKLFVMSLLFTRQFEALGALICYRGSAN